MIQDIVADQTLDGAQPFQTVITLTQNYTFHSILRDLPTLYNNFCLLSYMSKRCMISITNRFYEDGLVIDEFETELDLTYKFYLYRFQKAELIYRRFNFGVQYPKELIDGLEIEYIVSIIKDKVDNIKGLAKILCKFNTEVRNGVQYIHITISDENGWIPMIFDSQAYRYKFDRIHEHRILRQSEIQYFWIQPKSQRHRTIPGKHIALALQGGGVKGICYIGAIKAIRKQIGNIKISSVIGSSAGGILCLAICCELDEEQISNFFLEDISKITKNDIKYKNGPALQAYLAEEKRYKNILAKFLKQFGIIDDRLFDIITDSLADDEIQEAVLQVLQALNPSFPDLLSIPRQGKWKRKFLLYGLLKGKLLTGESLKNIAIKSLLIYRDKKSIVLPEKYEKNPEKWAAQLTLRQFYKLCQIQFTCTSVDLKNHILRFFNHKTTPNLPVCQAVMMTGSFPVAFQSHRWSTSKWGKYYIHYEYTRKEIDLEGCQFTDGGMLANFPIKYLDNQKMRPMYFSHKTAYLQPGAEDTDCSQTLLYGFGLNDIKVMEEEQKKKLNEKFKNFGVKLLKGIDSKKVVGNLIWRTFTKIPEVKVKFNNEGNDDMLEIPLFQTLSKLLSTYKNTKDNLTKQCFATQICTSLVQSAILYKEDRTVINESSVTAGVNKLYETYKRTIIQSLKHNCKHIAPIDLLISNLEYVRSFIDEVQYLEHNLLFIQLTINHIITTYLHFSTAPLAFTNLQNFHDRIHKKSLQFQQTLRHSSLFMNANIKSDFQKMIEIIERDLIPYFIKIKEILSKKNTEGAQNYLKAEAQYTCRTLNKIREYQSKNYHDLFVDLEKIKGIAEQCISKGQLFVMDEDLMFKIFEIKKNLLTSVSLSSIKTFLNEGIIGANISQLTIGYINHENKRQILSYLKKLITKQFKLEKNPGIHLILESRKLSQIYFHEYMGFLKIAINELNAELGLNNKNKLFIQTLTGSDYHAVALFLYASDFSNKQIREEIWKIKDLIILNPKMVEQYDKGTWAQNNIERAKQIRNYIWQNSYDIFQEIQKNFRKNEFKSETELRNYFKDKLQNTRNFIDELNQGMQTSLNFVADSIYNLQQKNDIEKKIEEIQKKLVLDLTKNGTTTKKQYNEMKQDASEIVAFFLEKYLGIVKYILYEWHENVVFHLDQKQRKEVWKGLIMGEALTGIKLKQYILEKLEQLGLKPNTTLEQFYELSREKIHLNFLAVETSSNAVTFLNYKTTPYMPVWAAILATSSHPLLFRPIPNRTQWNYLPIEKFEERIVRQYFSVEKKSKSFQSAEYLMKIPFELVTNHRIKQLITNHQDEIYICFNFEVKNSKESSKKIKIIDKLRMKSEHKKKFQENITNKPLTITDILFKLKFSLASFNLLFTLPAVSYRTNLLELFMNSHDNLITKIYSKQLVKLPVRLGTLDFAEICDKKGDKSKLFMDTVMQSYYVSLENIKNSNSHDTKVMYIRVQHNPKRIKKQKQITFQPTKILLTQLATINSPRLKKKSDFFKKEVKSQLHQEQSVVEENQKDDYDCVVRFLSFHQTARSILQRCKIFYQMSPQTPYTQITEEFLKINLKEIEKINLKIIYPELVLRDIQLRSSASIRLLERDAQTDTNSSFVKQQRYFELNFKALISEMKTDNLNASNFGFVYCLQFNQYTLEKSLLPEEGQINETPIENYEKYVLGIKSIVSNKTEQNSSYCCDKCARPVLYFKSINVKERSVTNLQTKFQRHLCSHCKNPNQRTILACLCLEQYCAKCKYQLFVDDNELKCPLNHTLLRKQKIILIQEQKKNVMRKQVQKKRSEMETPVQEDFPMQVQLLKQAAHVINENFNKYESMCEICDNISSHEFYYDSECDVLVCESCCLKIFSSK